MIRRTTVCALALALLILVAPPAAAKGPTEVEVHNLQTGKTTVLGHSQLEMQALSQLVGWPDGTREPPGVRSGALKPVATLTWQNDPQMPFWRDQIYSDETGWRTWVQRRDDLSGSGAVTWARVEAGHAFHAVLSAVEKSAEVTTPALQPPAGSSEVSPEAPTVAATSDPAPETSAGFDGESFGWGAGLAGLLAGALALAARWRRSRRPDVSGP